MGLFDKLKKEKAGGIAKSSPGPSKLDLPPPPNAKKFQPTSAGLPPIPDLKAVEKSNQITPPGNTGSSLPVTELKAKNGPSNDGGQAGVQPTVPKVEPAPVIPPVEVPPLNLNKSSGLTPMYNKVTPQSGSTVSQSSATIKKPQVTPKIPVFPAPSSGDHAPLSPAGYAEQHIKYHQPQPLAPAAPNIKNTSAPRELPSFPTHTQKPTMPVAQHQQSHNFQAQQAYHADRMPSFSTPNPQSTQNQQQHNIQNNTSHQQMSPVQHHAETSHGMPTRQYHPQVHDSRAPFVHSINIPPPPPNLRSEISPLELERLEERYLGQPPKIRAMDDNQKYNRHTGLKRPLFIRTDHYRQMLNAFIDIKDNLKQSEEIIYRLENLKKNSDVEFSHYKTGIEDIQRKFIYIDKSIFES